MWCSCLGYSSGVAPPPLTQLNSLERHTTAHLAICFKPADKTYIFSGPVLVWKGRMNEVVTEDRAVLAEGVDSNLGEVALPFLTSPQSDSQNCAVRSRASERLFYSAKFTDTGEMKIPFFFFFVARILFHLKHEKLRFHFLSSLQTGRYKVRAVDSISNRNMVIGLTSCRLGLFSLSFHMYII